MTDDRPPPGKPRIVAFTSPTNGAWRTEVVANVAWTLAAAGRRVAIADWGSDAPHVHDYLQPFQARTLSVGELLDEVLDDTRFSTPARHLLFDEKVYPRMEARRYELPGGLGRIDVLASPEPGTPVRGFDPGDRDLGEVETLRAGIQRSIYDHVLIDSPAPLSPGLAAKMARLCDVVALCFEPQSSSIRQSAWFAGEVWDAAPVGIRVLAVPVRHDETDRDRAERTLTLVGAAFHSLLTHETDEFGRTMSAEVVGVPPHDDGSPAKTLAVLACDDAAQPEAYQRLVTAIGGKAAGTPRTLTVDLLESYRRSVGLLPTLVALEWAPRDRPWADWVRAQLIAAGAQVADSAEAPGTTLVRICSQHPLPPTAVTGRTIAITVDETDLPPELASATHVPLAGLGESTSRTRVLEALSFVAGPPGSGTRFPGAVTRNQRTLPPRLALFAGRGAELEAMRNDLAGPDSPRTWWLTGAAGVGKSELVKEYAHRFEFDYEHVWWIPAADRMTITESLAKLARVLGVPAENQVAQKVLDLLGRADETRRWLLVYDGADEPGVLDGLVPTRGRGHVVVTSRSRPSHVDAVTLGPFTPDDSIEYLRNSLNDVGEAGLREVADRTAHQPLALRLARAWIVRAAWQARQQTDSRQNAEIRAAQEFCAISDALGDGPAIPRTVQLTVNTLRRSELGRSVLRVAAVCSFLSPDGIALSLLHKVSLLAAVSDALDDVELDGMLWHGVCYGMFHVSWRRPGTVTAHPLLLSHIAALASDEELSAIRTAVQEGLAVIAPSESELDQACAGELRELRKHIVPSGAPSSDSLAVRRWLVSQMGHFLREGDHEAWRFATSLCERLLENWPEQDAPGLRMRLRFHLGNLHRYLNRPIDALTVDENLLADQRRILGREHPRTLRTARGVAHGQRVLGLFTEALVEEQATVRGLRRVLGENHPDTLRATNNLAQSLFLAGEPGQALKVQSANRDRRREVVGPDHLDVWWSACSIGTYLRELGRYDEAWNELQTAKQRVAQLPGAPRHLLRIKWNQAIIQRHRGDSATAKAMSWEVLTEYRQTFGEDHPDTRACKLSFAADHFAVGEFDVAVDQARECLNGYWQRSGPFHAFSLMCQLDHAIFQHWLGNAPEVALLSVKEARGGLVTRLGDVHPWALAGRLAHAVVLGRTSDTDLGRHLLGEVHDDCVEYLGVAHPTTRTAAANLDVSADEWQCVVLDVPEM
ncbi:Tetratricopeptide repeat-containing protein [Lentzea waywayandensis]|uniref:Tetratricopeptide repeat-containing protein n=1 Tax=Lentzea waywayandensis TaxID=84724 RepID=A0A1I6D2W6_9PSEU|nr:FxSxx-COOH system tetratricopeptide repeat protein [Lentzea waywayandensis]SFQ99785.1 Tetratricopeptide repeat-containing protein [Lentzea waywayandensis]